MAKTCKYAKLQRYVSYDSGQTWEAMDEYMIGDLKESPSVSCIDSPLFEWRLVDNDYLCVGTSKYTKLQQYVSADNGETYFPVSPANYKQGTLIEEYSEDCGYEILYRWVKTNNTICVDYSTQYLTFVAIDPIQVKFSGVTVNNVVNTVDYSLDSGITWNTLAQDTYTNTITSGNIVMFKGNCKRNASGIGHFTISGGTFDIEGNVMSLLFNDNFVGQTSLSGYNYAFSSLFANCNVVRANRLVLPATTLSSGCYQYMFKGCTSLIKTPELLATTLEFSCYQNMFQGCTSLTVAPELPATTLESGCYRYMFKDCTSLTKAPELPATTLTLGCYSDMFENCTSLTKTPKLPATTLISSCYESMFQGCSSLNEVTCLATDISARYCTANWLSNVSSSGTFYKNPSMSSWSSGGSGIPNDWTVTDYQG